MIEKHGIEEAKDDTPGEKTSSTQCQHPIQKIRSEGEGDLKVYFCDKCKKYLPSLGKKGGGHATKV